MESELLHWNHIHRTPLHKTNYILNINNCLAELLFRDSDWWETNNNQSGNGESRRRRFSGNEALVCADSDDSLFDAITKLHKYNFHRLLVTDMVENNALYILTYKRILYFICLLVRSFESTRATWCLPLLRPWIALFLRIVLLLHTYCHQRYYMLSGILYTGTTRKSEFVYRITSDIPHMFATDTDSWLLHSFSTFISMVIIFVIKWYDIN